MQSVLQKAVAMENGVAAEKGSARQTQEAIAFEEITAKHCHKSDRKINAAVAKIGSVRTQGNKATRCDVHF